MAERSIEIVTGDGENPGFKHTHVALSRAVDDDVFGNGREVYEIDITGSNGATVGASISKEAIFEALSEFFNVDITPRPEPIKPLAVGDTFEDIEPLEDEQNRKVMFLDGDGDVWLYDEEQKDWSLRGEQEYGLETSYGPFKVIAIRA